MGHPFQVVKPIVALAVVDVIYYHFFSPAGSPRKASATSRCTAKL
jgi:hypothetical protein